MADSQPSEIPTQRFGRPKSAAARIRGLTFPVVAVRGYDRRAVDEFVEQMIELVTELEGRQSRETVVQRALDEVGEETAGILQRDSSDVPKQKQIKMQMQVGALAAIPQLESRTDEQLQSESKHRVAAKAILGARAAERYDVKAARQYFNEALAGSHPQERPALRQMMKASLALAERRPDELKEAMERLRQDAPSGRQLFMLRMMGLLIPPSSAGIIARVRGILLLIALVIVLLVIGFGLVKLIALPFGGIGTASAVFFGFLVVVVALGVLVLFGRRRQARAKEARAAGGSR